MSRINVAVLATAMGTALLATGPAPALAAAPPTPPAPTPQTVTSTTTELCQNQPAAAQVASVAKVPWAQQALDFSQVWSLTEGGGVTVATIDSGYDYNAQLGARVKALDLTGTGIADCVGHGTAVAGIIAAGDERPQGNLFIGVAPKANILSIKVTNEENNNDVTVATPELAQGIMDAVSLGAGVINISMQTNASTPQLEQAVLFAESHNVVVVVAAGNDDQQTPHGPYYPASYPGVLSVGSLQADGSLSPTSDQLSNTDVTAPGIGITSIAPHGFIETLQGTSYAAPFVAGVAALIRARYPNMNQAQVVERIEQTADGSTGPGTGYGMVNPLEAIQAVQPPATQTPNVPVAPVSVPRLQPPDSRTRDVALAVTAGGIGGVALLVVVSLVIAEGRRRHWRPGRVPAAPDDASQPPKAPTSASNTDSEFDPIRW